MRKTMIVLAALVASSSAQAEEWSKTTIRRNGNTSTWQTVSPRGVDIDVFRHTSGGTEMTTYHQNYGLAPGVRTNTHIYGGNSGYDKSGGNGR
jgi:hypothetical protein